MLRGNMAKSAFQPHATRRTNKSPDSPGLDTITTWVSATRRYYGDT